MSDAALFKELGNTIGEIAFVVKDVYSKVPWVVDEKARIDKLLNKSLNILGQFEYFQGFDDDE